MRLTGSRDPIQPKLRIAASGPPPDPAAQRVPPCAPAIPQRVSIEDPVHGPLLESYGRSLDDVAGVPPVSEGALKYSGALGRAGSARWAAPRLNRRSLADVWFGAQVLIGNAIGETRPEINGLEIGSNADVMTALPHPEHDARADGSRARCWFRSGAHAVGRTVMDILTPGPWHHTASKPQAAARLAREAQEVPGLLKRLAPCESGTGDASVRVTGEHGDAEMEEYIRLGEAEHDTDDHAAFDRTIGAYVGGVNALLGGQPELEAAGADPPACAANLRRLAGRDDWATQFVLDINAAGSARHAGGRHVVETRNVVVSADCSAVTVTLRHGKL